jgi:hypothetical protein
MVLNGTMTVPILKAFLVLRKNTGEVYWMRRTRLIHFGTTRELRDVQPSIKHIFPAILWEITKKAVASEWYEFVTGNYFYVYKVDQDAGIEALLANLVSGLSKHGIDVELVRTEKIGSYEKYVFGRRV